MWVPKSIRWRLQFWYGALLCAVLLGFGLTTFHLEKARSFRKIDAGLQERISALVDALRSAPELRPGNRPVREIRLAPAQAALFTESSGYYFVIWMQPRDPIAASANAPLQVPRPDRQNAVTRMRGDFRESFLFAAPVNCILVGCSIASEQSDLRTLAAILAGVGGAVLAAGLCVGWWLASRAIRPVEEISATAAKIADGDLTQRIDSEDTDSELGRLANVLNTTFARLQTTFDQQARFTADAAHDLRTPVSVILTQTQSSLARDRPAADYRETLEVCQRAGHRMRHLIESLLELARLDGGQESLRREECDLGAIARDGIELLRPLAEARRITIHADFSPGACRGDAERLSRVATNLLGNAIDYNEEGGEIRVTTTSEGGFARMIVSNTGPRIPAEELPHIFERFHRVNKARTAGHAGLGLAIARAIVRMHGGEIQAVSTAGDGATFTVTVPR